MSIDTAENVAVPLPVLNTEIDTVQSTFHYELQREWLK